MVRLGHCHTLHGEDVLPGVCLVVTVAVLAEVCTLLSSILVVLVIERCKALLATGYTAGFSQCPAMTLWCKCCKFIENIVHASNVYQDAATTTRYLQESFAW